METSKINFNELFNNSTASKNLDYNALYSFIEKEQKVHLTSDKKKVLRKQLQNFTPTELAANKNFCSVLVASGFVDANKAKDKFKPFLSIFDNAKVESIEKVKK